MGLSLAVGPLGAQDGQCGLSGRVTGREGHRDGLGSLLAKGRGRPPCGRNMSEVSCLKNANPALCLPVGVGVTEITRMTRDPVKD